jgi:hypothetical protein
MHLKEHFDLHCSSSNFENVDHGDFDDVSGTS